MHAMAVHEVKTRNKERCGHPRDLQRSGAKVPPVLTEAAKKAAPMIPL